MVLGGIGDAAMSIEYYCLDGANMNRRSEQPVAMRRYAHTSTLMSDGRILIAGGIRPIYELLSSTQVFDPYTGRYESGPQLEDLRSYAAAALLNDSATTGG